MRHSKLVIVVGGISASYYSGISYMYMGLSKNPLCVCVCIITCTTVAHIRKGVCGSNYQ